MPAHCFAVILQVKSGSMRNPFSTLNFFSNSRYDRQGRNKHSAALLANVLVVLFTIMVIYMGIRLSQEFRFEIPEILLLVIMFTFSVAYYILRKGYFVAAAIITISICFAGMTFISMTSMGIRDAAVLTYLLIIIVTSLLLGRLAAIMMTILSILSVWVMVYLENSGYLVYDPWRIELIARDMSFVILATLVLVVYYDNILNNYIRDIGKSRADYRKINAELTERNKEIMVINSELREAMEKSRESDRLKTAFLANLSHEIRTPMNGIVGFSELVLSPESTNEEKQEYNRIIASSCRQLLGVVNDIVDISRIESGIIDLHKQQMDLNDMLRELYGLHSLAAREKEISLEMIPGFEDAFAGIIADQVKLQQILNNLLGNAIKFTNEGFVKFGYVPKGKMVEFYVIDSGIGIPADKQKDIFERFIQADTGLSRRSGGTGLGLSIAKAYVEKMGGKIWVRSEEGKGSEVYFTIPLEKEVSRNIDPAVERENGTREKIPVLLVEDTESNEILMKGMLRNTSYEIVVARTGEEALELFQRKGPFGLILMDIKLPGMDGYEVTREIRKQDKAVPVIAQTAYAFQEDREKAIGAGCNDLLSKPISRAALEEVLRKYRQ
jgi:signal transduction histidine kinase